MATRKLIAAAPERSATRDHLVRLVADRLDVPGRLRGGARGPPRPRSRPTAPSAGRARAAFDGGGGRAGLPRPLPGVRARGAARRSQALEDAHLPSDRVAPCARPSARALRRSRWRGCPTEDAELAELVAGIAIRADDAGAAEADALAHELPAARAAPHRPRDPPGAQRRRLQRRQGELAAARQQVQDEMKHGHGAGVMSDEQARASAVEEVDGPEPPTTPTASSTRAGWSPPACRPRRPRAAPRTPFGSTCRASGASSC